MTLCEKTVLDRGILQARKDFHDNCYEEIQMLSGDYSAEDICNYSLIMLLHELRERIDTLEYEMQGLVSTVEYQRSVIDDLKDQA